MTKTGFYLYGLIDCASGLQFKWASKNELLEESVHDQYRSLLRRLFIEEKIPGSRSVIEMCVSLTGMTEVNVRKYFGNGVDCKVLGQIFVTGQKPVRTHQEEYRRKFAHEVRSHILSKPYDIDLADPRVSDFKTRDVAEYMCSQEILATYHFALPQQARNVGIKATSRFRNVFLQCRITGRCWSLSTACLNTFLRHFSYLLGTNAEQFNIWTTKDDVLDKEAIGLVKNHFESTVSRLKNKQLYLSETYEERRRQYQILTNT